jgi:hypothetical protein
MQRGQLMHAGVRGSTQTLHEYIGPRTMGDSYYRVLLSELL